MIYLENFTKIASKQVYIHKDIPDESIRLAYTDYKRLMIIDINDIVQSTRHPDHYNIWMTPKTFFFDNSIKFSFWNDDYAVYPYIDFRTVESMNNDDRYIKKTNRFTSNIYHNSSLIAKLERIEERYYVTYFINNKILDNILQGRREIRQKLFVDIVSQQEKDNILRQIRSELPNLVTACKVSPLLNNNTTFLKPDVNLYDYQVHDINWMSSIENDVINDRNIINHFHNISTRVVDDKFALLNNNLYPTWLIDGANLTRKREIRYYGGNLVSEVGLGKTLVSLYHIISTSNKLYNHFVEFKPTNTCNYFYKRGTQKGNVCNASAVINSLYCRAHSNTPFVEKRSLQYKNLQDFNVMDVYIGMKLKTNATLIVCPNQLCDQWIQEYYSKFLNDKRVIFVATAHQYDNLTLGDVLFADIVITSYQFLLNSTYQKQHVQQSLKKVDIGLNKEPLHILNCKHKPFNLFHWNRVMLDEAHEIQNINKSNLLKETLLNISSTFKWNITGTPFANGVDSFLHLMEYNTSAKFFSKRTTIQNCTVFDMLSSGIDTNMALACSKLFRQNSKESVKNEYIGKGVVSNIRLLDFTNQERNIYNSYLEGNKTSSRFSEFLIKICCHSELYNDTRELIQNCKTLNEIQQVLLQHNKNKIASITSMIQTIGSHLHAKYTQLEQEHDEDIKTTLRQEIGSLKRSHQHHQNSLQDTERTYNYLKNAIDNINSPDSCPICLDPIPEDSLCITRCGHKFCWNCVLNCHNVRGGGSRPFKCPSCNTLMNTNEIYKVTKTNSDIDEVSTIINRVKSTKIGNIIHYIKTSLQRDDKIILFSQWETLLHKVGDLLQLYKIKVVYCNGSVYQRKRAINSFITDPTVQVILLSSRNAASGINLTQANKIILFEPIYGTEQYRTNIENQIIGRANRIGQERQIEVIRFIIRDTIEEDIINNNIDDSKIRQMNIT